MKYSDIIKYNNSFKKNIKGNIYNITVISNVTIEPLKEILEYYKNETDLQKRRGTLLLFLYFIISIILFFTVGRLIIV